MGLQFGFGSGVMYGIRTDLAGQTPIRFGAMQDVSIEFNGEIKELYAQGQFAIDAARGKVKIMGKAKLAQISAVAFNAIFFGATANTGQTLSQYNEPQVVPASVTNAATSATTASGSTLTFSSVPAGVVAAASGGDLVQDVTAPAIIAAGTTVTAKNATTVTLSHAVITPGAGSADSINFFHAVPVANQATYVADLGVYYSASGNPLTYTTGIPTAGEYTEINGNYYFSAADGGLGVLINYLYTTTGGFTVSVGNPFMGTTPRFMGVFSEIYEGNSIVIELYACVASKLTMPTKIDDYLIPELDFSAYQNAAGQTVTLSMNT